MLAADYASGYTELEDFLELRDPKVIRQIAASKKDYDAGRVRSAWYVLNELKRGL